MRPDGFVKVYSSERIVDDFNPCITGAGYIIRICVPDDQKFVADRALYFYL